MEGLEALEREWDRQAKEHAMWLLNRENPLNKFIVTIMEGQDRYGQDAGGYYTSVPHSIKGDK